MNNSKISLLVSISISCFSPAFRSLATTHILDVDGKIATSLITFGSCAALHLLNELHIQPYWLEAAHNADDYIYALQIASLSNTMGSKIAAASLLLAAPLKTYASIKWPNWVPVLNRLSPVLEVAPLSIQNGFSPSTLTLMIHNFLASEVHSQWPTICHNNQTLCITIAKQCLKSAFKVAVIGRTDALASLKGQQANSATNDGNYIGMWMGAKFSNCMNMELNKAVGNDLPSTLYASLYPDFFEAAALSSGQLKPVVINEIASAVTHVIIESTQNMGVNKTIFNFLNGVIKLELKKPLSGKSDEMLTDFFPIASAAAAVAFSDGGPYDMLSHEFVKAAQYAIMAITFESNRSFKLTWRDCVGGFTSAWTIASLTKPDIAIEGLWSTWTAWKAKFTHHAGPNIGKIAFSSAQDLLTGTMSVSGGTIVGMAFQQHGWIGKTVIFSGSLMLAITELWQTPLTVVSLLAIDTASQMLKHLIDNEAVVEAPKIITPVLVCAASVYSPILLPLCQSVVLAAMSSSTESFIKMTLDDFAKTFPNLVGAINNYIDEL